MASRPPLERAHRRARPAAAPRRRRTGASKSSISADFLRELLASLGAASNPPRPGLSSRSEDAMEATVCCTGQKKRFGLSRQNRPVPAHRLELTLQGCWPIAAAPWSGERAHRPASRQLQGAGAVAGRACRRQRTLQQWLECSDSTGRAGWRCRPERAGPHGRAEVDRNRTAEPARHARM